MSKKLINFVDISKSYGNNLVLDELNLYIRENEFITLLGPSGCGKTTTLRILGGFETPDKGQVIFDGVDITSLPPNKRNLNTVFQKYALFPHMSIAENIAFGLKINKKSKEYINDKIKYALKLVNLDGFENRSIDSLSGGQQQRIAIARAIVNEPKVLLLDELSHALELTDKAELSEENNILEGIIRFGGETAKEVMTSRLDVVDLEIRTPFKDVLKCIVENAYSRIPVYAETRDNIKGVLYIKDLLPHLNKGDNFRWQSLIRPAYFVPETKMIDDLLRDFQANKIHIAIVVDEFGGTSGIVTMEDIIEEIVGEIRDEYDDEERTYAVLNDHTWVFEAKTQLTDFYKITKIDEETFDEVAGDADTLAGLLLELKGEFPVLHEKVAYDCYEFEVLEMDNRRILKVKFTVNEPAGEGSETEK